MKSADDDKAKKKKPYKKPKVTVYGSVDKITGAGVGDNSELDMMPGSQP